MGSYTWVPDVLVKKVMRFATIWKFRRICGGCHVPSTGQIGVFKYHQKRVRVGIRRIEAITSEVVLNIIKNKKKH